MENYGSIVDSKNTKKPYLRGFYRGFQNDEEIRSEHPTRNLCIPSLFTNKLKMNVFNPIRTSR